MKKRKTARPVAKSNQLNFIERSEAGSAEALEWLRQAINYHMAGNLAEAEKCYKKSIEISPNPTAVHNLGGVYRDTGRRMEAEAYLREAIRLSPIYPEAYSNLGLCLTDQERFDEAIEAFNTAISQKPDFADAYSYRGNLYRILKNYDQAISDQRKATRINPNFYLAYNNLGNALTDLERYEEALPAYYKATRINPNIAISFANLGATYFSLNRHQEACEALEKAVALQPDVPGAMANLASVYGIMKRYKDAAELQRKATEIDPNDHRIWNNYASALMEVGDLKEAEKAISMAIELKADYAYAHNTLANLYRMQGKLKEAIPKYKDALSVDPDYLTAHSNLLFTMESLADLSRKEIFEEACRFEERAMRDARPFVPFRNERTKDRRIKIAYISPDLWRHSVSYFFEPILANHDRKRFHVTCYADNFGIDDYTQRMQPNADHWMFTGSYKTPDLFNAIREQEIDILVELAGHTANNRMKLMSMKAAPIQVSYIGYPSTTGLRAIDYRFTDAWADPVGETDAYHTERLIRLPSGFLCYRPVDQAPEVSPAPCLENGYVTFGSFNAHTKVSDVMLDVWAEILREVPNSRLFLKNRSLDDPITVEHFKKIFASKGVDPDRLETMGNIIHQPKHFAAYHKMDIALDPFPYNGTTTTCEALWMGAPVIALEGDRHAGRVGVSLLNQVGMTDFIARDYAEYVEIAKRAASDHAKINEIRMGLREKVASSSLCDGRRHTLEIEQAYLEMWETWCSKAPETPEYYLRTAGTAEEPSRPQIQVPEKIAPAIREKSPEPVRKPGVKPSPVQAQTPVPKADIRKKGKHRQNDGVHGKKAFQSQEDGISEQIGMRVDINSPAYRVLEYELNQGASYFGKGMLAEAEKSFRRALEAVPDAPMLLVNLGAVLKKTGRMDEAYECYMKALNKNPNYASAYTNLAAVLIDYGKPDEGIAACRRAIELSPNDRNAYVNLAMALSVRKNLEESLECYRKSLKLGEPSAEIYNNMSVTLHELGRMSEAEEALRESLRLNPNYAESHANYATILTSQARLKEALTEHRKVVALSPDFGLAGSNLLLHLHYDSGISNEDLFREHVAWGEQYGRVEQYRDFPNTPDPDRKLRLGFVSADFSGHSVSFFFLPVLENFDRSAFEIYCYSNVASPDGFTRKTQELSDHWRPIFGRDDKYVAELIHNDQIDILVDLGGHTSKNRLGSFARKPAPVQVNWIGYPNTTGLAAIDYRFTDAICDPPGPSDELCVERLVRLPHGFLCYMPHEKTPEVNDLPALKNGYVTFGSFNNITKVSDKTIELWSRVLVAVPGSRLLFKAKAAADEKTRLRFQDKFNSHGVAPDRLEFVTYAPDLISHLKTYHRVDIALDTFPYNGTTTTFEALYMGIPVVTLKGDRHSARVGGSILERLDMPECVAENESDFAVKAARLAADFNKLASIRANLRNTLKSSDSMNPQLITPSIENAFREIWKAFCAKGDENIMAKPKPVIVDSNPENAVIRINESLIGSDTVKTEQVKTIFVEIKGGIQVAVPYDLQLITPYVLLEQEDWFETEMEFVRSYVRPGMKILDVGAAFGAYSLTFASLTGPNGRVWAVEPSASSCDYLQKSIMKNGFRNITLINAALTNKEGKGTLNLSRNPELHTLRAELPDVVGNQDTTLRTLDSCSREYGLQGLDFVKMDAENEERNILASADLFFSKNDPLFMFELEDPLLTDLFTARGFNTYRLVPGLNLLIPYNRQEGIDPYMINIFACSGKKADELEKRGLLLREPPSAYSLPLFKSGLWTEEIRKMPFSPNLIDAWQNINPNNAVPGLKIYQNALDLYTLAKNPQNTPGDRFISLKLCLEDLVGIVKTHPTFPRLATLSRVACDFGARALAVEAVSIIINIIRENNSLSAEEPFFPIVRRLDEVDPGDKLTDWLVSGILEQREILRMHSSFFGGDSSLPDLEKQVNWKFHSPQIERRRQLVRMRFSLQSAPEPSELLAGKSTENLNPDFWTGNKGV